MSNPVTEYPRVPFQRERFEPDEMLRRGVEARDRFEARRSVRDFSSEPVPKRLIELAIEAGSTAPSGAHRQPWRFVAISDSALKSKIREAAEVEERESYIGGRMPDEWLEALAPLGTDWRKPHLEDAPWVVVVFAELFGVRDDGSKRKNYYVKESVGIACGLFIAALEEMGLVTLTHTPSPMEFLREILGRPKNEKPFIVFPVGYPADDATVPDLARKSLDEVALWFTEEDGAHARQADSQTADSQDVGFKETTSSASSDEIPR